ncbi:hypothetical protein ACFL6I_08600 [candidate division KSB1 bacterium]
MSAKYKFRDKKMSEIIKIKGLKCAKCSTPFNQEYEIKESDDLPLIPCIHCNTLNAVNKSDSGEYYTFWQQASF